MFVEKGTFHIVSREGAQRLVVSSLASVAAAMSTVAISAVSSMPAIVQLGGLGTVAVLSG